MVLFLPSPPFAFRYPPSFGSHTLHPSSTYASKMSLLNSHIFIYAYMYMYLYLSMGILNAAGPSASFKAAPPPPPDGGRYSAAHIEVASSTFWVRFTYIQWVLFFFTFIFSLGFQIQSPFHPSFLLLLEWLLKLIKPPKQEMSCKSRLMCAAHFGIARTCSCLSFHSYACPKQASCRSSQSGARASRVSTTRFRPLFPPFTPQPFSHYVRVKIHLHAL